MSEYKREIISLSEKMVAIPSETYRTEETRKVLDLVDEYLGNQVSRKWFGVESERGVVVSCLWGDEDSILEPKLLLSGHVDVVEAGEDQYVPEMREGKLYGRGAGDMKGHVAAMVIAYKRWIEKNNGTAGVGLLLTGDEEKGGFAGTGHIVNEAGLRPDVVFVPDGEFDFDIVLEQKAPHHILLRGTGSGGHASRAFKVENPLNNIVKFYEETRKKYDLATKEDDWQSTFSMTKVWTPFEGMEKVNKKLKLAGKLEGDANSENSIPNAAYAWFSWRWPLADFSFEEGMNDIKEIAAKCNLEIIDQHGYGAGCHLDKDSKVVQEWKTIIEDEIGRSVGYQVAHGATDGRFFHQKGAKVITTSAIAGNSHEVEGEWVDIDSLVMLSKALYRYQKLFQS